MTKLICIVQVFLFSLLPHLASSLNVVIAGGTGPVGRELSSILHNQNAGHKITILTRNSFLASAPARVSNDFGWLGKSFLEENDSVTLRDWDGGDLLDIVGCDWMGWQEETLKDADCVINLCGGYTQQRNMACERIIRESLSFKSSAKQVMLTMADVDLVTTLKQTRAKECEDMLSGNCAGSVCLRAELNDMERTCEKIMDVINAL
jgi:NAD dependent epimerase/dehydratase family enzyme